MAVLLKPKPGTEYVVKLPLVERRKPNILLSVKYTSDIAPDSKRKGLVIAAGDCGHGFTFAPVLGGIIADVVEQKSNPILENSVGARK